jgi:riboflavin kinase/FMN adenylyltransferase
LVVVTGPDYRFGRDRAGDVKQLKILGKRLGFQVDVVPRVLIDGHRVSSTAIREALTRGEIGWATRLLSRAPRIWGRVVRGAGRGRALGVPTANLSIDPRLVVPEQGIFAARVFYNRWWEAAFYVGNRPSFTQDGQGPSLEVHLLDFEGDLYGKELEVELIEKIRDDRRFDDLKNLTAQMNKDLAKIRQFLRERSEPSLRSV